MGEGRLTDATDGGRSQTRWRLALTASLALLFHVITAALLALEAPEPDTRKTVQVRLVTPGHHSRPAPVPSPTAPPSPPYDSTRSQHSPTSVAKQNALPDGLHLQQPEERKDPLPPEAKVAPTDSGTSAADTARADMAHAQGAPDSDSGVNDPAPPIATVATVSSPEKSQNTAPIRTDQWDETDEFRQLSSRLDAPQIDPYRLALSRHLLSPLKRILRKGPIHRRWNAAVEERARTITIELQLMGNGALRNVVLVKGSGNDTVDKVAVQSALAASPYPEPPETERRNGFRFRLDLIMSPVPL